MKFYFTLPEPPGLSADFHLHQICSHLWVSALAISSHRSVLSSDNRVENSLTFFIPSLKSCLFNGPSMVKVFKISTLPPHHFKSPFPCLLFFLRKGMINYHYLPCYIFYLSMVFTMSPSLKERILKGMLSSSRQRF